MRSISSLTRDGHYAQAYFYAQQSAEKSLKAIAFFRGAELVKSHALTIIIRDLALDGILAEYAPKLDVYYLTTRYPDALPEGALPAEQFTATMAADAQRMAEAFLAVAKTELAP